MEYEADNLRFATGIENSPYHELFLESVVPFMVILSSPSSGTLRVTISGSGTTDHPVSGGFFSQSYLIDTVERESADIVVEFITQQGVVAASAAKSEPVDEFRYKVGSALVPLVPKLEEKARERVGRAIDDFFSNNFDDAFLVSVANEIANEDPSGPSPQVLVPMLRDRLDGFRDELKSDSLQLADAAIEEWALGARVEHFFRSGAANPDGHVLKSNLNSIPALVALRALLDDLDEYVDVSPNWNLTEIGQEALREPLKTYQDYNSFDDLKETYLDRLSIDVSVSPLSYENADGSIVGTIQASILGVSFDKPRGYSAAAELTLTPPASSPPIILGPRTRGFIRNSVGWPFIDPVSGEQLGSWGTMLETGLTF